MHAVEATDDITVDHAHHRLGHGAVDALVGGHTFLDDDLGDALAVLGQAHAVAQLCGVIQVLGIAHRHHAAAAVAMVGLDDHEGPLVDAVFLVLAPHLEQRCIDVALDTLHAFGGLEVHLTAAAVQRVDQPRVHAQQLGELLGHLFITLEVARLAPQRPAGMQRRQQVLLVQAMQRTRDALRQVVVEQDGAGVEVLQPEAAAGSDQGLQRELAAVGQGQCRGRLERLVGRAQAHVQPGLREQLHQALHVAQVERVAGVTVRHQQQVARLGADLLDGSHRGLYGQRQHLRREVVEAVGEQVGRHRCQLEAGVAQVHRGIKRWRVLHPLQTKPALDGRHRLQDALLKLVDGPGEGGGEMGDHGGGLGGRAGGERRIFADGDPPRLCKAAITALALRRRLISRSDVMPEPKRAPEGAPISERRWRAAVAITCCRPSRRAS